MVGDQVGVLGVGAFGVEGIGEIAIEAVVEVFAAVFLLLLPAAPLLLFALLRPSLIGKSSLGKCTRMVFVGDLVIHVSEAETMGHPANVMPLALV